MHPGASVWLYLTFFEANGLEITEGISPALFGVTEAAEAGSPLARGIDQQGKAQEQS